jgi:hypothetical protein
LKIGITVIEAMKPEIGQAGDLDRKSLQGLKTHPHPEDSRSEIGWICVSFMAPGPGAGRQAWLHSRQQSCHSRSYQARCPA